MTLTKVKPRRPNAESRKRSGKHHRHSHDYIKTYWPYLPVVAILSAGIFVNSWLGHTDRSVLGYATDMSIQNLLIDTNVQRSQNGAAALNLDSQLDTAAQNKANDMAARDYWSHNTPDGQTPWTFITAAGYTYTTAGENLAYGFSSASDTIAGWMNSPEHRANLLNTSFHDVGFGIVNIPDYQGTGPETLVVAMYGTRAAAPTATATPKPIVTAPAQHTAPVSTPAQTQQPLQETPVTTTKPSDKSDTLVAKQSTPQQPEPAEQRITRIQLVSSNTPINTLAVSMFGLAACGFFLLRHGLAWRKVLVHGERFVLRHPLLDVSAAVFISLSIIFSHTAGLIR